MAEKRTFGLVGDYGSDSEEEEEGEEEVQKKVRREEEEGDNEEGWKETTEDEEKVKEQPSARWAEVRKEYEDSSLMYKFVTEESGELTGEKAAPVEAKMSDEERQKLYKEAYEASLAAQHEARHVSNQAVDWEIQAIQEDIQDQRKRWEAVYSSDEEGEAGGAETGAVVKDMKRRVQTVKAVVEEVTKKDVIQHRAIGPAEPIQQGERWKRLQIIAEARHRSAPERYGGTYPGHKFPLRD